MAKWIKMHHSCIQCESSDGASTDDKGWTHCFSCGAHYRQDKDNSNQSVFDVMQSTNRIDNCMDQPSPALILPQGSFTAITSRKISEKTCKLYGYSVARHPTYGLCHYAQCRDQRNNHVATHIRINDPKGFRWVGQSKGVQLFGQHLGSDGTLIITEGELDAMSIYECLNDAERQRTVVASVTSGTGSVTFNIRDNLHWIQGFDRVVLFFDQDEAGSKAQTHAADLIGLNVRTVEGFPYKDASDAWVSDDGAAIKLAITKAKSFTHDWLLPCNELDLSSIDHQAKAIPLPWQSWNDATNGGMRPGEIWLIGAGTGIGKSRLTRSIALSVARNQQIPVAFIPTEEHPMETALRMVSECLGEPVHLKSYDQRVRCSASIKEAQHQFDEYLHFIYASDGCDAEELIKRIRTTVMRFETKVIFVDHLHSLLAASPAGGDQVKFIDRLMEQLRHLAVELGITLILVCQLARAKSGKVAFEEGGEPGLHDIKGSGAIAQAAHYVFMLQRDCTADSSTGLETRVHLKKNRNTGQTRELNSLLLQCEQWVEVAA